MAVHSFCRAAEIEINHANVDIDEDQLMHNSPEAERFDIRTQLMTYNIQFTDDIRLIITNVLDMRRNFDETKKMQNLMNAKSLYRGSNYKAYSDDIRLNRPLQMPLQNFEIQAPPRNLMDFSYPSTVSFPVNGNFEYSSQPVSQNEESKINELKLARQFMSPIEFNTSGIENVAKSLDYHNMYQVSENDFDNFNIEGKHSQKMIL